MKRRGKYVKAAQHAINYGASLHRLATMRETASLGRRRLRAMIRETNQRYVEDARKILEITNDYDNTV